MGSRHTAGVGSLEAGWKEDAWLIREVCGAKITPRASDETGLCRVEPRACSPAEVSHVIISG